MNNKNFKLQELKRWLKTSLKNKISINEKTVITYLMLGFAGFGTIAEASWTNGNLRIDGDNHSRIAGFDAEGKTGDGSVIFSRADRINKNLVNSVIIGIGGNKPGLDGTLDTQKMGINIEGYDDSHQDFNSGIVAIGAVRVQSNPHGVGRTGTGGQAVAIGNDVTSTSQAVAIGNNTYALGGSSIAIGNDDITTYRDKVTTYDYTNYLKPLYDKIDLGRNAYGIGDAGNAIYSPNVAGGEGSISIGSRSMAYKPGSTALGTLAYALGQGATALGTQSRAEGTGSIAIGNKTRNFANNALAVGNDSQILNVGGTAMGLRARAGGEGSIAIGTDVYANTKMNTGRDTHTRTGGLKDRAKGTDALGTVEALIKEANALVPEYQNNFHGINEIIQENGSNALAIGTRSAAIGSNSIVLGRGAFATKDNAFGLGSYSYADAINAMAIGTSSRALATSSIALGAGTVATDSATNSTVIGTSAGIAGANSSLVGSNSEVFGDNSIAFGNNTNISKKGVTVSSDNNIAIGNNINIGPGVTNSMAYGKGATIGKMDTGNSNITNSTAFGLGASVTREYDGALPSTYSPENLKQAAIANSKFMYTGNNAMAIGNNANAKLENSVALGVNSQTDYTYADLLKPGWTARNSIAIPTSGQTGVISVGSKGAERRIVNVASGANDTDAVNVIQLRTLEEKIENTVDGIETGMHYLSVNKKGGDADNLQGSETVTELIERRKNYDLYLRYKKQELQIAAREKWQGEKFDPESKQKITDKLAEIVRADTSGLIRRTASGLGNITVDPLPTGSTPQVEYRKLVEKIEDEIKKATTDAKYRDLVGGTDIEALQNETNYSNKGANGTDSLAIGFRASTKKVGSLDSKQAIAMGYRASAENKNTIAIGSVGEDVTKATGESAIAIGNGAQTTGSKAMGLGENVRATGENSIAIGSKAKNGRADDTETKAYGSNAVALGSGANSNNWSVAVGGNAKALGDTSVAMGDRALSIGANSTALGSGAQTGYEVRKTNNNKTVEYSGASYSVALGNAAKVYSNYSIAIGNKATVGETQETNGEISLAKDAVASVVLGSGSKSLAEGGTVVGADSELTGKQSAILGRQSTASANNTTVLGANSTAAFANSVALGQGVTVTKSEGAGYLTNQAFTDSGKVVSVGNRRINQLADGQADNDAVTVAQLKKAAPILEAQNSGGITDNRIASNPRAIIKIQGDGWGSGDSGYEGKNIATYISGDANAPVISIGLKDNPTFKTLKLNNGARGSQDLTLSADNAGNLSVGSKKITDVANGTGNTDAVNYSQLNSVKTTADTAKSTADDAKTKANTAKGTADTAKATAEAAQTTANAANTEVTSLGNKQLTFAANSGNITRKLGETIGIKGDNSTISTSANATNNEITIKVKDSGIGTTQLADNAVTEAKLANNAVTAAKIKDGAVTENKLDENLKGKINKANTVAGNNIRLTGDPETTGGAATKTGDVSLAKEGGIEFAINGTNGLVTKASGTKVEIGLDSTIKAKLDKLSTDPNATYATKTELDAKANKNLGNIGTEGQNAIKDQARKAVVVEGGEGITVTPTEDANNHKTKYTVKINDTTMAKIGKGVIAANNASTVTGGTVNDYLTKNYLTKTNVTGTVKAADDSPITVNKGTDDANGKEYTIDVKKSNITGTGGITVANGTGKALGDGGVQLSIDDKAITLAKLDQNVQDAINSISSKASTLNIGTGTTTKTVNLLTDTVKVNGSGDVTVSLSDNKEFTIGLSEDAKKKLDNVSAKSDGKDKKDSSKAENADSSGNKGLTKVDGLNGKDLTDKVNALRNGEAGTVVFTDSEGKRLVKENNGKYYPVASVKADGNLVDGVEANTGIENPELRVVNAAGSTTTPNKLSNIANGKIGTDSKDAINGSQIKDVLDKLGVETDANTGAIKAPEITGLTKADGSADVPKTTLKDGLNAVIAKVNEGIKYKGDSGEGTQQLGTVFNVNRATKGTPLTETVTGTTINYVGDNLITKYTKNDDGSGKLEIGFKESPTFKDVTADSITTKTLTFDDGTGKKLKVGPTSDGKALQIGDQEIATKKDVILTLTKDGTDEAGKVDLSKNKLQVVGENGVSVDIENQKVTVSLDADTKAKIDNVGKKSDGRDNKDSTVEENTDSSGNKGLTKVDGLNGKDLTDKVNALRNGEAGTVVFTDSEGKRLVKENNGKYYPVASVKADGNLVDGVEANTGIENPELRVVNAAGSTTTPNKLSNIANGKIGTDSKDAINGSQIKDVLDKLGVETDANTGAIKAPEITGLTKADGSADVPKTTLKDGLNAVIAKVNEGIKYKGDSGEGTQQLGTVFNVNRATKGTPLTETVTGTTINYVGDNLITKYTKNDDGSGKLEIGFKESPTFKDVTADNITVSNKVTAKEVDADKAKVKGDLTFDDGTGKPTTIVAGDGKGSLLINGKKVATSESAPVLYTDADGKVVEKGQDGKIYKSEDLEGKRFDTNTKKYYNNDQFDNGVLKVDAVPANLQEVPADNVKHALAKLKDNTVTGGSVLTNIANGNVSKNSTDAVNGGQLYEVKETPITFKGDTDQDVVERKLGQTLNITGDGVKVSKNKTGDGLVLSIDKGKVQTNNVADQAVTSAKLAKDARTVVYIDAAGDPVELGADGKLYKAKDLVGKTYVEVKNPATGEKDETKSGYYNDEDLNKDKTSPLDTTKAPVVLAETTPIKHALNGYVSGGTDVKTNSVLTNVGDGEVSSTSKDAINGSQFHGLKTNTIKLDGNSGSTNAQELGKENGLSFGIKGTDGIETSATGTDVTVKLSDTYKQKLDNLDTNANEKYANKNADNIDAATWKAKLGLSNAVSGTGTLSIDAATKGTTENAVETPKGKATVKLDGNENFKLVGTDGITVTGADATDNKTLTFGLDQATKDAIKNIGKSTSDGRDGLDGTDRHNGSHGLTAADGLNGKDLTDKVNALRNGEAGTVVFTDSEGNRLVKANDGKYYKPEFVSATGETQNNKEGQSPVAVANPELRTVNSDGKTTTPIVLNNIASALGLDGKKPGVNPEANYDKPITAEDAKKVMDALTKKNSDLNRAVTLRDLQALAVAGLDFTGNTGTVHRALGTTLKIVGKEVENFDETKFNTDYSTENVATNVKENGTVEIGFKKSPTFDDVKAKNIEALNGKFENLKVNVIEFKTATGDKVTIATGKDGNLYINGVAVPTAESAPVIYTDVNGNRVEKGQDGKIYKPKDLEHLTYVAADNATGREAGYFNEDQFETKDENGKKVFVHDKDGNKVLKKGAKAEDLSGKVYSGEVVHNLSPLDKDPSNSQNINDPDNAKTPKSSRLVNVAAGVNNTDAVNVGQLNAVKETPITFKGDTDQDVVERKLGQTLNITGDGVKVSKNKTGDGLVLSIDKGKVQTNNVADQAVTSAKLAKDARTVVYIDAAGDPVELGADGKLYKAKDLVGKTYVEVKNPATGEKDETKSGYYNDEDLNKDKTSPLDTTKAPVVLAETTPIKHALNGYVSGGTDVKTNSVLTNVGDGEVSSTSKDAINGSQIKSVLDKLGVETDANTGAIKAPEITGLTKADGSADVPKTTLKDGLNAVIAKVNEGIKYKGDSGEGTQQLGTVFNVNRATKGTPLTETVTGTTINYVGDNLITKYTKNDDGSGKLEIGFKESPTFKEVTATDKITTPELVLKGKDKSADVKLTAEGGKAKVDGKEIATKDVLDTVVTNTIKLTANGETAEGATDATKASTDAVALNKENGISFGIKGADGLTTTAEGTNVTVKLSKEVTDKLANVSAKSEGRDGKDGTNGNNGSHGLTAKDGLNGKDLTEKVNALRNGEAGTVVFTDSEGNRLVKANDGKYYKPEFVSATGETQNNKEGQSPVAVANPELRTVNSDGKTTTPIVLNNIASALGLDGKKPGVNPEANYDKPITAEDAKKVMDALIKKNSDLNRAVTLSDLQALAVAGLDFTGNTGTVHRALGTTLNVVGQGTPAADFAGANGNINVVASEVVDEATKAKITKLEIQLAKALQNIESIQNGDTKVTLGKDGVSVSGQDGKATVGINGGNGTNGASVSVNGKDGKDGVTIKGTDGTNGSSIVVNGTDGKPGVTINGGNGTDGKDGSISFAKDGENGTGSITGLKEPDGTDKTAATTVSYVTNQIEGAKTDITNNINSIVDGGMTYKGNSGEDVKVKLNKAVNIKGEGNYDGTGSATGNIAVVGNNTNSTLEIKLNKDLKNIDTISKGDNTKITLGENGVSVSGKDGKATVGINGGNGTDGASVTVNGKDGKDGVTIKGTDGTNGSSIVVNGTDGKPGVTINGGNGTDGKDGSISFAKDGENGTGSITGLKDPEFNKDGTPKDKTAAATVNYVTNEIKNVTNNINNAIATMDKGLNFVGNDNEKVNAKLDGTVSIKGEGTVPTGTNTAANNIKVEKDTTDKSTGLVVKLADKLTGMTGFETKEEEGKKVTINKDGITFNKDDKGNGTGSITGLKDNPNDSTSAVTRGTYNTFVTEVTNKLNESKTINYKADNQTNGSVSLDKGMEFKGDSNITTKADKDGVVEFKLSKNLDLSTKAGQSYTLGTIKGIKTDEKDPTSIATVDYVEQKMGDTAKIATKALVGVANAVAMANLPQVNNVGNNRHVVSAAYGHYEGQNALALGISGINKERTVVYKGSAALNTNGKIALGVGVGYQFGTDKHDEIQNDASVKALKEEVAVLKNKDAKNTNIITELKELMKKKDIENEYKSYRLEEENREIKSYIDELRKENEKTREELKKLMEAVKEKKAETK